MPFVLFHNYFPELAEEETRSITVLPGSGLHLPPDEYGFLEMYRNERRCDCRRVLFCVIGRSSGKVQAVIGWGWEGVGFYAHWMKSGDRTLAAEMKVPAVNPLSPGTRLAPALMAVVRNILLKDPEYVERIKRHYRASREKVDSPRRIQRPKPRKRRPKKRR
jgi:hypothetical protein